MKTIQIEINLFEKNDRVRTFDGMGRVTQDEEIEDIKNLEYRKVFVKLDESSSSRPDKRAYEFNGWFLIFEGSWVMEEM